MMTASAVASPLDRVYAELMDPQGVRLLNLLQMNGRCERCFGAELFTADGRAKPWDWPAAC
jgi:hypothetical protein